MLIERARDGVGENFAVHGQRFAARYRARVGHVEHQRAQRFHLGLQHAGRGEGVFALQGIRADQLGRFAGLMGLSEPLWAHFMEDHRNTVACQKMGGLAAGQTTADHMDAWVRHAGSFTSIRGSVTIR